MTRFAGFVDSHAAAIVATWAVAGIVSAIVVLSLGSDLTNRGFATPGSQSARAEQVMAREIPGHRGTELFVLYTRQGRFTQDPVRLVRNALRHAPGVLTVTRAGAGVRLADDGSIAAEHKVVSFRVRGTITEAERNIPVYRSAIEQLAGPETRVGLMGGAVVSERYSELAHADLLRAERIAVPLVLLALVIAFTSVTAAALPVLLAGLSLLVTFAGLCLFGRHVGLSVFVTNTASVLALGLSVDFSLFMVARFREELRVGAGAGAAMTRTLATMGRAVMLSALTVMTALLALFVVGIELFDSMAIGATIATLVSAMVALTLLPALMRLLGVRIDRVQIGRLARASQRATVWRRIADLVVQRPLPFAVGTAGVLLIAALPSFAIRTDLRPIETLPPDDPVRRQTDRLTSAFYPGSPGPVQIVTRGRIPRQLWRTPGIVQTWGETHGRDGWFALQVILGTRPEAPAARSTVVRLRRLFAQRRATTYVGGVPAASHDLLERIDERTPWVMATTVVLGACLLAVGLRSVLIPIKAMIGTLLSVGATMGILVQLFPGGAGPPRLEFFVPLLLFAVIFGLSVDYEVFLLSRVREAVRDGQSTPEAVTTGLVRSARSITLAGVTLAIVFLALATSRLPGFQQLGVGVALAIAIDVTLVRCLLVPATIVLLGRWNWWVPWDVWSKRPDASRDRARRSST